jgi:hypothetical protein
MKGNKGDIVREIFLRSTPSLDIDLVPEGVEVDCDEYSISVSEYEKILAEYCESKDERTATHIFMLRQGPRLLEE